MGTTADKLQALLNSKKQLKETFGLAEDLPFSQYASNINVTPGTGMYLYKCAEVGPAESSVGDSGSTSEMPEPVFAEKFEGSLTNNFNQLGEAPVFETIDGRQSMLLDTSHTFSYPANGLPSGASARTITAWVYPMKGVAKGFFVFYGHESPENAPYYMLGLHSHYTKFQNFDANAGDFSVNQWYHLTATYEEGQAKLYINGTLSHTKDKDLNTETDNATYPLTLGWASTETHFDNRTNAYISDLQIYDTALTDEQVTKLYEGIEDTPSLPANTWNGYKAVLTDGYYTFEETLTKGLTYGKGFIPEIDKVYDGEAMVVTELSLEGQS